MAINIILYIDVCVCVVNNGVIKNLKQNSHNNHTIPVKCTLTCSNPAVSPTGFRWFLSRSRGLGEECRANMIIANSGRMSPLVAAACKSSAAASMCSLTASHTRTSRLGSLFREPHTTLSRFSHPTRLDPWYISRNGNVNILYYYKTSENVSTVSPLHASTKILVL